MKSCHYFQNQLTVPTFDAICESWDKGIMRLYKVDSRHWRIHGGGGQGGPCPPPLGQILKFFVRVPPYVLASKFFWTSNLPSSPQINFQRVLRAKVSKISARFARGNKIITSLSLQSSATDKFKESSLKRKLILKIFLRLNRFFCKIGAS